MCNSKHWTIGCVLAFLAPVASAAAGTLFETHDILEVQIEAPLTTLMQERSDVEYLDGTFRFRDEVGEFQSLDLKLRARGRYRRQKQTCNFPPVRLNFRKQQVEGSAFEGEDKLKLVTHCQNRRDKFEQFVLREYLAYRILHTLTDKSFRARLMRITYINTEDSEDRMTKYGFVIEDDESVAKRLGLDAMEVRSVSYAQLDARHSNLINVFQYLIGNTDYSLVLGPLDDNCCHNTVPLSDGEIVSPIPYDFDFAGIVDAPYADPNPKLKIRDVRTRLYRGRCENNQYIAGSIATITDRKAEISAIVDELTDFDRQSRQSITRYLAQFYAAVEDAKSIEKNLVKECSSA